MGGERAECGDVSLVLMVGYQCMEFGLSVCWSMSVEGTCFTSHEHGMNICGRMSVEGICWNVSKKSTCFTLHGVWIEHLQEYEHDACIASP